jgi:hypothetical protein
MKPEEKELLKSMINKKTFNGLLGGTYNIIGYSDLMDIINSLPDDVPSEDVSIIETEKLKDDVIDAAMDYRNANLDIVSTDSFELVNLLNATREYQRHLRKKL